MHIIFISPPLRVRWNSRACHRSFTGSAPQKDFNCTLWSGCINSAARGASSWVEKMAQAESVPCVCRRSARLIQLIARRTWSSCRQGWDAAQVLRRGDRVRPITSRRTSIAHGERRRAGCRSCYHCMRSGIEAMELAPVGSRLGCYS